jgi:hypothetical protein
MARIPLGLVAAILAATLMGCAGPMMQAEGDAASPSTSAGEPLRSLAGRWRGSLSETGGWYLQGQAAVDLTLSPDGTWSGTSGGAPAHGRAEMKRGDLILSGTARSRGTLDPVYLRLRGDGHRRWGETLGRFGGRQERASASLEKVS